MKKPIGIDLGTTFSAVATIDKTGRPKILLNRQGPPITPSVIYFGDSQPLVGEEAKEMQGLGESRIASFFKRNAICLITPFRLCGLPTITITVLHTR